MKIAVYNRYWNTRGGGERYAGVLAEILSQEHEVVLLGIDFVDLDALAEHLGLDLGRVRFELLPPVGERELAPLTRDYDLFINCTYLSRLPSQAPRSVYLVLFPQRAWPAPLLSAAHQGLRAGLRLMGGGRGRPWRTLHRFTRRLEGRVDGHDPAIPGGYDLLLSISEFTRSWVEKRWGLESRILAPPVDTKRFAAAPGDKERVILSVGRFFQGSHNKKHVEMLHVFRDLHDRGHIPEGWEYHLVGNVHRREKRHQRYFAQVERLAEGYPVRILTDLRLEELVEEYRRAAIFWHAAGWGESGARNPEKLEHFGITTCEAMSACCIPVVIAKAGQVEIVDHGETGFQFRDAREFGDYTRRLINGFGQPWTREMSQRAAAAVQRYSRQRFEDRLMAILAEEGLLVSSETRA